MKEMYNDMLNKDLLKKPKITGWISGPTIVLFILLFWPVGIYLAYKRARIDKKAAVTISTLIIILGVIFLFNTSRFFSNGLVGIDVENIIFCIITGTILISFGIYTRRSAKRFLNHIELVVEQGDTSIDNIADSMSSTYDEVKKDMQELIGDEYFNGSFPDGSRREMVFSMNDSLGKTGPQAAACKSCGAINKVNAGAVGECEFCGSPISI
jgi:hypothetical protein